MEFPFPGYKDLEISTQIILHECKIRDIEFEILDRKENFLRLRKGSHIELIKEATKTRLDSFMTFLIMENKSVSKVLLKEAGIAVPQGKSYSNPIEAKEDFVRFYDFKKVVKPVTTNFGIGITILDKGAKEEDFKKAIEFSFSFSSSIIIEEFISGPEYRFLVIGDEVVAVCNRIPANVVGDGVHTIQDLVSKKNQDPRRGEGHRTPLEKIQLGSVEKDVLQSQNLEFLSIPKSGEVVFLRRNSNISTGGDSIDCTDLAHSSYKTIALKAARSVGAVICGIDIITEKVDIEATKVKYGVLEVNFNPVLYIHEFPYQGKARGVGSKLLDALGF